MAPIMRSSPNTLSKTPNWLRVKKSPSLVLSVLFFNVGIEKGVLGAARRPPFACPLLQGLAQEERKTLQKIPAPPNGGAGNRISNLPAEPPQGPIWPY